MWHAVSVCLAEFFVADVDLSFITRQQEAILQEMAAMRVEHRAAITGVRDDIGVLTAMMVRLDHAVRSQHETNALIFDRLRKLAL